MAGNSTFLRGNLLINDNVLQNAHDFKVKKVVSCLSTCVFPDKVSLNGNSTSSPFASFSSVSIIHPISSLYLFLSFYLLSCIPAFSTFALSSPPELTRFRSHNYPSRIAPLQQFSFLTIPSLSFSPRRSSILLSIPLLNPLPLLAFGPFPFPFPNFRPQLLLSASSMATNS